MGGDFMVYSQLMNQYNELSEKERNALIIYKSRLGRAINSLDYDQEEIISIYGQYKKLFDNPKNIFLRLTVFHDVSFHTILDFEQSLREVKHIVEKVMTKMKLP